MAGYNVSEICGPYAWGLIHKAAASFPCEPCAEEGSRLMSAAHDLVNLRLGKQVYNRENFIRIARDYKIALERMSRTSLRQSQPHLNPKAVSLDLTGTGEYVRERLMHPEACQADSFRTVTQGNHRLIICNLTTGETGSYPQSRLHPRSEERRLVTEALSLGIPVITETEQDKLPINEDVLKAGIRERVSKILDQGVLT